MKKRTPPISTEDQRLFEEASRGTKPIVHDKVNLRQQRPRLKVPKPRPNPETDLENFPLEPANPVTGDEAIDFSRNGISARELKRLRLGHFVLDASLDLHGATANEAEQQLLQFIKRCLQQEFRFIRVIHGQGFGSKQAYPVIKNMVNRFLRSHPKVLAFCTCPPSQGGRGAVNVLIKHQTIADEE